jgi:hypothetical protein
MDAFIYVCVSAVYKKADPKGRDDHKTVGALALSLGFNRSRRPQRASSRICTASLLLNAG